MRIPGLLVYPSIHPSIHSSIHPPISPPFCYPTFIKRPRCLRQELGEQKQLRERPRLKESTVGGGLSDGTPAVAPRVSLHDQGRRRGGLG